MMSDSEEKYVIVAEIKEVVHKQFDPVAFQRYQQSVLNYGMQLWRESRNAALQRDPDASAIEVTTPDVDAATVRTEMRLARLRQLRFPFRPLNQFVSLVTGIAVKLLYDSANLRSDRPDRDFLLWLVVFLICIVTILILNYFETRAELLR